MKNKGLILSIVTLCILLILGNSRWVDLDSSVDFRYKYVFKKGGFQYREDGVKLEME